MTFEDTDSPGARWALTVIDSCNGAGFIIRRFQTFPLAPAMPDNPGATLPDTVIPLS